MRALEHALTRYTRQLVFCTVQTQRQGFCAAKTWGQVKGQVFRTMNAKPLTKLRLALCAPSPGDAV
jgi:hypothetical protein